MGGWHWSLCIGIAKQRKQCHGSTIFSKHNFSCFSVFNFILLQTCRSCLHMNVGSDDKRFRLVDVSCGTREGETGVGSEYNFSGAAVPTVNNGVPSLETHLEEVKYHRNGSDQQEQFASVWYSTANILSRCEAWNMPITVADGRPIRRGSAAARLLGLRCLVLSGRGLWNGPIPCPEEFYRLWCVIVCNLQATRTSLPWPALRCYGRGAGLEHNKGL